MISSIRYAFRGGFRLALAVLVVALGAIAPRPASASTDSDVRAEVQRVVAREYARAQFDVAQKKLVRLLPRCGKDRCAPETEGQIWMALGLVSLQLGQLDEGTKRFASALRADPGARLPSAKGGRDVARDAESLFAEAKKQVQSEAVTPEAPPPADAPTAPAPVGPAGEAADDDCARRQSGGLLERAECEASSGKLVEALRETEAAVREARQHRDIAAERSARTRLDALAPRVPHLTFVPPRGVSDLAVTVDGQAVPPENLALRVPVDPGRHAVHAEGTIHDIPMAFDRSFDAGEGETVGIVILLAPPRPGYLSSGQVKCMLAAKSQQELLDCLPQDGRALDVRVGLDTSAYTDTTHVDILTPAIHGSVASPTAGWNVNGSYLVDVVSAASPDIVSEASPPFREVRQAGTLGGGFKLGPVGTQLDADVSSEPDYRALGGGVLLTLDLNDKLVTPSIGYSYSHDTIGRSTTPFSVFHHDLDTSELQAGSTFVMSSTSVLLVGGTLDIERGDQSKPYRYVPMFAPSAASAVTPGASIPFVNQTRLPFRPLEQLPLARNRYAIGARFVHRFGGSTLRLEERLYTDTWRQHASTTDVRWLVDPARWLRLWIHGRFNAQGGANFYRLAYAANPDPNSGRVLVPSYRTDDRELGPLVTLTGGAGVRFDLGGGGKVDYALTLQADAMYSRYFESLFITERTAVYATLGFEAEFE